MKKYIFLLILLMLPLVSAQEQYNSYSSLEIELDMSSEARIQYGPNAVLGLTKVRLNTFPKNNDYQKIHYLYKNTNPSSTITEKDNQILMEWDGLTSKRISFFLNSKITRENDFKKIKSKIKFPLLGIPEDYEKYLEHTEFIDLNKDIENQANEIIAGETDAYIAATKIADWVKNNINYSLNTLTANAVEKSSWVLKNKEGVCDEITNLFISMCRSVGIPSRFVSGTVYTNIYEEFGNHGWAEIYFPGYGWIPFDVTFGQYGWTDPTHITLMTVLDPGTPSVSYNWKSLNVDITPGELDIKTKVTDMVGEISPKTQVKVNLLKEKVGFGSYIPIEVNIKNLNEYYVPITLYASKAPEVIGSNTKNFVLKPEEEKNLYWIIKVDDDLNEKYIYTSLVEFKTSFGALDAVKLTYSKDYEKVTKEWAETIVNALETDDEKVFIFDVDLSCVFNKNFYYSNELIDYTCEIKNTGNIELKNLNLCSTEKCTTTDLYVTEAKTFQFEVPATEKIIMTVKAENQIKTFPFPLNIKKIPEVFIVDYSPKKTSFGEAGTVNLKIFAKNAYNLNIQIDSQQIAYFENMEKPTEFYLNITYPKRSFSRSHLPVTFTYQDQYGNSYKENKKLKLEVQSLPWYHRLLDWLFNHSSL